MRASEKDLPVSIERMSKKYEVHLKSIYSEKAAKFEKSLPLVFDVLLSNSQNQVGEFFFQI